MSRHASILLSGPTQTECGYRHPIWASRERQFRRSGRARFLVGFGEGGGEETDRGELELLQVSERRLHSRVGCRDPSPRLRRQGISPAMADEVAALPETVHRDPADRILVATARTLGAKLVTSDRRIADAGLVEVVR